ncbi:MAG: hypothetical protein FWE22_03755 [Firmicutes bacterium]|nr:hypothetical protein [Bacillota bacterium]
MFFRKNSVAISSVFEREPGFKDYRFTAKTVIESLGMEACRNPEDIRNQDSFNNMLRNEVDFFVLIVGEVKSEMVNEELKIAIAIGLPILVFAKIDKKDSREFSQKICDSLRQISPELYDAHITTFENCESFDRELRNELLNRMYRRIRMSPVIGVDPPVAYTEGVTLISNAKHRIVVTQNTSILLLGPRLGNTIEQDFYDELVKWLKKKRQQKSYFLHVFSLSETKKAMKSGDYDLDKARKQLIEIMDSACGNTITIRGAECLDTTTHVIGDTGMGLNFKIASQRYYLFLPSFFTKDKELQQIISGNQRVGNRLTKKDITTIYDNA